MGNPQGFNRAKISEEDLKECKKILNRYPMAVFSHFPYVANLAGSKDSLAWCGDVSQDKKTKHVLTSLEYELNTLSHLKGGVVIHPGNYTNRKEGLETIAKSINKLDLLPDAKLILENSAGQGTSLATTLDELKIILDGVDAKNKDNMGVCIDTCHIFAYGDYDLRKRDEVDRLFKDFDRKIGMENFSLLHLNDSVERLKSKKDRHACLGCGHIWEGDMTPLKYLLCKCKENNIPIVLETTGADMLTLADI
jgi:apurinic endonuclease APN1